MPDPARSRSFPARGGAAGLTLAYLIAYLLLEWLCQARPVLAPAITPWHPQAGLTVAYLLAVGWRGLPAALLAALVSQVLVRHVPLSVAAIGGAAWIALVAAAFATWLKRSLDGREFGATVDATRFAGGAAVAAGASAAGFVGLFLASGAVAHADALRGIARYGLADLNGVLMLAPLMFSGGPPPAARRAWRERRIELSLQFALTFGILSLIFAVPDSEQLRFLYLLFVPVIWLALRWGWRGGLVAVMTIQAALIFAAEAELHTPRFIDTQVLVLTLALTALLLGSVVAERRRSEQRLRERDAELSRAMRFAVAGELASATAHELNQPMTALVSYLGAAEILARTPGDDERLRATVRKAAAEALRAAEVLHRLRNFYIGGRSRREAVEPEALARAVSAGFADRLQRARVALDVVVDGVVPAIEADETQLHIVLHNLLANAIDALDRVESAERRIELRVTGGEVVTMTVEDSGPGLDTQAAERLFEPFVTSKPDGMGLGLAISRTLVRAGGGELGVLPRGRLGGARFKVVLPLVPPVES